MMTNPEDIAHILGCEYLPWHEAMQLLKEGSAMEARPMGWRVDEWVQCRGERFLVVPKEGVVHNYHITTKDMGIGWLVRKTES